MRPRVILVALLTAVAAGAACPWAASAHWSATGGAGAGSVATGDLTAAVITAPATSKGTTTLTWATEADTEDDGGDSSITYTVERNLGGGAFAAVATGPCAGALTRPALSCTDTVTVTGTYGYRVVAKLGSWTATSNPVSVAVDTDVTAPVVSAVTRKTTTPTNAASLQWTVTFSESVTGVDVTDFALVRTGDLTGGAVTAVTGSGATYTVTATTGTGDGTLGLDVDDDDTIRDAATNRLGGTGAGNGDFTGTVYTLDRTAPTLTSLEMLDTDTNGKVNQVKATFSETLATTSATTPWTLASVPSGGTLTSVSRTGAVVTLTVAEGTGAADTAVGAFTVALAASSTGVKDAAGNQASFAATAPADVAKPVLLGVTDTNGTTDGLIQAADTLSLTFSEALKASTVPAAPTVTESRPASGNTTLSIPGVTNGALSMGAPDYVATASTAVTFAGSATASGTGLTVTVGACSTNCTRPTAPATTPTVAFTAATTLTDAAGNAATRAYSWVARAF